MKSTNQTPRWATDLVIQVCADYHRGKPGELKWLNHEREHSSGVCSYGKNRNGRRIYHYVWLKNGKHKSVPFWGRLTIRAGTKVDDQRLVLLHELAHWMCVRKRSEGHTVRFWKMAFELYQRYGVDMKFAIDREKGYKQKAVQVYERYYKD